ncbi:MAG: class 1 fructose-bisphosphatase [Campylobacterota bacterium]|nr:class 1 fructose-bisphosphatase [Campylobacterota bacterium]
MIEVYNAITNIANDIEKNVFVDYDRFAQKDLSEEQIHDDIYKYCSDVIEKEFEYLKSVKGVIGKDKKQMCQINENGKYLVSFVAIDNIELLDLNFSLGTIFSIYENSFEASNLKAAIYITYGPTFQLVFASKDEGVKYFSNEHGEFIQQDSLELNEKGKINSTAGKINEWDKKHKDLIKNFFDEGYRLRFSNSLALDTHHILFKKGGIYSSPATITDQSGILEVIFEAFPIAFILELAGGEAIDGKNRVLDIKTPELHQKTPIYFGSKYEIQTVLNTLQVAQ